MSNVENPPYDLLGKYFSGEASPEEAMAVNEWIDKQHDHRVLYNQIAGLWDNTSLHARYQLPDKQQVLDEIKRKISSGNNIQVVKGRYYWGRIAAILLVLLGGGMLFFMLQKGAVNTNTHWISRLTTIGIYRDTLPDQSIAVVNSYSSIKYVAGFSEKVRSIDLKGEAWFNVTFSPDRPFTVHVGDIHVKVLGTAFNVRESVDSIAVAVQNGAIMMYRGDSSIIIKAGQEGMYNIHERRFSIIGSFDGNKMGYATRVFNFEDASLKDIIIQLEKTYGITVVLENKELENCTMSSSFENKPIKYVFDVIAVTLNVQCRFENDRVYVSGSGCN
jgi:ferric-dicitrate binding protein FerR (iron transport regulator)